MKKLIVYISLILPLATLPAESWGQYLLLEGSYPVLYAEGLHPSTLWELGRYLRDEKTKATIRHTVNAGIGDNIPVNNKLPRRLLIAPTNAKNQLGGSQFDWAAAMGFSSQDNTTLASGPSAGSGLSGCATYTLPPNSGFGEVTKWRLPTQRELAFIWLFHTAFDQALHNAVKKNGAAYHYVPDKLEGAYWSSTESSASNAYYFNFGTLTGPPWTDPANYSVHPTADVAAKTAALKVRCVSDY